MKAPDVCKDWRVITGIILILLGAVNRVVGLRKSEESSGMMAQASRAGADSDYLSFDELDAGANGAVLKPLVREEERASYAAARMDFYHATFLTGQLMAVAGVILILFGFIAIIKRDARHALRSLFEGADGQKAKPPSKG